ncbi:hypothetical protein M074_0708, partial [Bacteroides fragilis str. DS-166]
SSTNHQYKLKKSLLISILYRISGTKSFYNNFIKQYV